MNCFEITFNEYPLDKATFISLSDFSLVAQLV